MTRRTDRIAEAIKRLTSEIIHSQLKDPRITGLVTVTKTEVTPDLKVAKVYYSLLGDERDKKLVAQGLKSARGFIRKHIADALKLRHVPDILFKTDKTFEYKERISKILDKIKEEKNEKDK